MAKRSHLAGKLKRPRGLRQITAIVAAGLVVLVVCVFFYVRRPSYVATLASDLLGGMTGTEVKMSQARIGLDGTIDLRNVSLHVPGMTAQASKIFDADQVFLRHNMLSLMRGQFEPRSLTFINPTLHLTDDQTQGYNYEVLQRLRAQGPRGDQREAAMPEMLPELALRNGQIRFSQVRGGELRVQETIDINGNLNAFDQPVGQYAFRLQQERLDTQEPLRLTGNLDLKTASFNANMDGFRFEGNQRYFLPQVLRQWWDLLDPKGEVQHLDLRYDPGSTTGLYATIDLHNIRLNLPYLGAKSRMNVASGRFVVTNDAITVADLKGEIEGFDYLINGDIGGFELDAPFSLVSSVKGSFHENARYMPWLPEKIQMHINRFSPTGKLAAQVRVKRAVAGGAIDYSGKIDVSEGQGSYYRFPYPVKQVTGSLHFSNDLIKIDNFQGIGSTGGAVTVSGTIKNPGPEAQVDFTVIGKNMPVDPYLYGALHERYQKLLDMVFLDAQYKKLIDAQDGLLVDSKTREQLTQRHERLAAALGTLKANPTPDQTLIEKTQVNLQDIEAQLERPVFDLGGVCSFTAKVHRPAGLNRKYVPSTTVDVAGVNIMLTWWPYPIKVTGGQLRIEPGLTALKGITGTTLYGGAMRVAGTLGPAEHDATKVTPDIKFDLEDVPVNALLRSAINEHAGGWLETLGLVGRAGASGRVYRADEDNIEFEVTTHMASGRARPFEGQYDLERIKATAHITRGKVRLEKVSAYHNDTQLTIDGAIELTAGHPRIDLKIGTGAMSMTDPFIDLIPPQVTGRGQIAQLVSTHQPRGVFDAVLDYTCDEKGVHDYRLDIRPGSISFLMGEQRVDCREVQGKMILTPMGLALEKWSAAFSDKGKVKLEGKIAFSPSMAMLLAIDMSNDQFDPEMRAFLPRAVHEVMDALEITGAYHLKNGQLSYRPAAEDQPGGFDFAGSLGLENAGGDLGVPVTELRGVLKIEANSRAQSEWPDMKLSLDAAQLRLADRQVKPLRISMDNAKVPSTLKVTHCKGRMYGGSIVGDGEIRLDQDNTFTVRLTLDEAQLGEIVSPRRDQADRRTRVTGKMSADMNLQGVANHPEKRIGRGMMMIRAANLGQLPLTMATLQVISLNLPLSDRFDQADVSFVIDGDDVKIDKAVLEAPTVRIEGHGVMSYKTHAIDLDMTVRSPGGLDLGPITELIDLFKDQLVSIKVQGTLEDPKPKLNTLKGFRGSIDEIIGKKKLQNR